MNVLERIVELRDKRGWSNYRLAREAKISDTVINNLFRRNNFPTIPTLEAICAGLGITLSQFFSEDKDNEAIILNDKQKEMLRIWDSLTNEKKESLLDFLKRI